MAGSSNRDTPNGQIQSMPDPVPPQIPLAPVKVLQARFNPLADVMIYVVVFVGGCLGTGMRFGLTQLVPDPQEGPIAAAFHGGTFLANMLACFIYAALTTYISQASWIRKRVRQLTSRGVGMGMCGGFSTLSALAIEELTALRQGNIGGFVIYVLATFMLGLLVTWLGTRLGLKASAKRQAKVVAEAFSSASSVGRHAMPSAIVTAVENTPIVVDAPVVVPVPPEIGVHPTGADGEANISTSAIEPKPDTAEIPLVSDPFTGEVHG